MIEQKAPFIDGHDGWNQNLSPRFIIISLMTDMSTVPQRADIPKYKKYLHISNLINSWVVFNSSPLVKDQQNKIYLYSCRKNLQVDRMNFRVSISYDLHQEKFRLYP